jgi:hypothetical protein
MQLYTLLKAGVDIVGIFNWKHTLWTCRARFLWWWTSSSLTTVSEVVLSPNASLDDHLHYPNDIDKSLNEVATDKIRKYRVDYIHNPPTTVVFMSDITSTSGRLHSEFIRLLFLKTHRETDRFFAVSGVQLAQSTSGLFHFRRAAFLTTLKTKDGSTLSKVASLRITVNIDGSPITLKTHTHPSHSQTSRLLTLSLSSGVPVPRSTQCMSGV